MVSRTATMWKLKRGIFFSVEFGEIEISQNDTVSFGNFDSGKNLLNVVFWKKADGVAIAGSIALNVVTITGAGTNEHCVYMVYGYKA